MLENINSFMVSMVFSPQSLQCNFDSVLVTSCAVWSIHLFLVLLPFKCCDMLRNCLQLSSGILGNTYFMKTFVLSDLNIK